MIQLHYRIKMRAFGVTFGTIEDKKDITGALLTILSNVLPATVTSLVGSLGKLPAAVKLYDDRGVFIELV